jgi:hypothetical protein
MSDKDVKVCFNHCPKCYSDNIDWGEKDYGDDEMWQSATCNKCGTEFREVYQYAFSEIKFI